MGSWTARAGSSSRTPETRSPLGKQTAENIIAIGRHLTEVKERLPYGQYGAWLEAEFPSWSEKTRPEVHEQLRARAVFD